MALYHASPRDPVWEYVLWPDQAAECMRAQSRRVALSATRTSPSTSPPTRRTRRTAISRRAARRRARAPSWTSREGRWLINPGSVGQPRDGDPRAAWLELDTDAWTARFHRVGYDIDRAAEAIIAGELPEHLARRLYVGQ